ncbi:hypothetical protein RI367_004133 [Sorochytrium milnesiophthora]
MSKLDAASEYTPATLSAPVADGFMLRAVTFASEWVPGVSYFIWRNAGMFKFRHMKPTADPLLLPLVPPSKTALEHKGSVDLYKAAQIDRAQADGQFRFWSVNDYHLAYKEGRTTPLKVAETLLRLITQSNGTSPALRAFVQVHSDDVSAQAQASTQRWQSGQPLSPLDGVPVGVKAEFFVQGYWTSFGSTFVNAGTVSDEDAFCVKKLRDAGAIIMGLCNMHEFGFDILNNNPNPGFGTPRNPYNVNHYPGGSSGGSSSAVASGLVPIAVGCDGGGSIRIPAAFCGVYGLKPTWSRVSGSPTPCLAPSVVHPGPIAASPSDLAVAYAIMAGPDPKSMHSQVQPPIALPATLSGSDDMRGIKLGIYSTYFNDAEPDVLHACQSALRYLESKGAEIVEIKLPNLNMSALALAGTILSEICAGIRTNYSYSEYKNLTYASRVLVAASKHASASDYLTMQRIRGDLVQNVKALMDNGTVTHIVVPTSPCTAPPILPTSLANGVSDNVTTLKCTRFVFLANLTGNPAIACPVGYAPPAGNDGPELPISLQIIGNWWDEDSCLRIASSLHNRLERLRPQVWYDVIGEATTSA